MTDFIQPNGTIDIDSIVGVGERPKAGEYVGKLIAIEGKDSKKGKPMVEARYELTAAVSGSKDCVGMDAMAWYSLNVTAPKYKGGKPFAPGIMELKMAFAAVGEPFTGGFPIDATKAAREVAKRLGKKQLRILIIEEAGTRTDDEGNEVATVNARVKILGRAGQAANPAAAGKVADDLLGETPVGAQPAAVEEEEDLLA